MPEDQGSPLRPMSDEELESHARYWIEISDLREIDGRSAKQLAADIGVNPRIFAWFNGIFPYGRARSQDSVWLAMFEDTRPKAALALGFDEPTVWRFALQKQLRLHKRERTVWQTERELARISADQLNSRLLTMTKRLEESNRRLEQINAKLQTITLYVKSI